MFAGGRATAHELFDLFTIGWEISSTLRLQTNLETLFVLLRTFVRIADNDELIRIVWVLSYIQS